MIDNSISLWSKSYATPEEVRWWGAEIEKKRGEKIPFEVLHDIVHDKMCRWRKQYKKTHSERQEND